QTRRSHSRTHEPPRSGLRRRHLRPHFPEGEFLVEDESLGLGATDSKVKNWGVHVVTDALLITGQNPASSGPTAKVMINALKRKWAALTHRNNVDHLVGECQQSQRQAEPFWRSWRWWEARREDRKAEHAHARLRLDFSTRASACGAPVTGSLLGSR